MSNYIIDGPRTFVRVSDSKGSLVAYVGGDDSKQAEQRAQLFTKQLKEQDGIKLVLKWSQWFYDHTDTFQNEEHEHPVGISLAYLWPAMLKGDQIEVGSNYEIVEILKAQDIPDDDPIWQYIDVVDEQEDDSDPE